MTDSRHGRFVVIVGPDGAGKTSVADELLARYPGRYFHFRPPFTRAAMPARAPHHDPPPTKDPGPSLRPMGWLRLARNAASSWLGYLTAVRPAVSQGNLVVGDRWIYGYMVQPRPLRFAGPSWLARLVIRLLPRPDLVVNLVAAPETVVQRKQELTLTEVSQELRGWAKLPVPNLVSVDAGRPLDEVVAEILRTLHLQD